MNQARHRRGSAVAAFAALMLVLQFFLGAFAMGAMAATPMLDAFGNPLCTAAHEGADDPAILPDCCTYGCNLASPLPAMGAAGKAGLLRPSLSGEAKLVHARSVAVAAPDHDPGCPRAPPPTA